MLEKAGYSGAIVGDFVGSKFEFENHLSEDFDLITPDFSFTDDTYLTIAVMDTMITAKWNLIPFSDF